MQENAEKYRKIIREKTVYRENGKSFNQPQSMQHKAEYTECHGIITFGNNTKSLLLSALHVREGGVWGARYTTVAHACIKSLGCEKYLCKICKAWELSASGGLGGVKRK